MRRNRTGCLIGLLIATMLVVVLALGAAWILLDWSAPRRDCIDQSTILAGEGIFDTGVSGLCGHAGPTYCHADLAGRRRPRPRRRSRRRGRQNPSS